MWGALTALILAIAAAVVDQVYFAGAGVTYLGKGLQNIINWLVFWR
ncbi:MAG: hypothetical protein AAGE76_07920 [Pseudomonadota bacterium]